MGDYWGLKQMLGVIERCRYILKSAPISYGGQTQARLIHREGRAISVDYYRKSIFYPTLERLGIDYRARGLTPHCTRHTFATLLNKAGAKTTAIQKLMDHTDYSTTANTYTHPDFKELWEAISML